jgi:hypothetical protein
VLLRQRTTGTIDTSLDAAGVDAVSAALVDARLPRQLCAVAAAVGRLMALCGIRDPWAAADVLLREPAVAALGQGALAGRMLALRAAVPGAARRCLPAWLPRSALRLMCASDVLRTPIPGTLVNRDCSSHISACRW